VRIDEGSAEEIVPELQQIEVGDVVPDNEDGSVFFTVVGVQPNEASVLYSTRHLLNPMRSIRFSWAFVLRQLPSGRTRMIMRARRFAPWWAWPVVELLIGPGDFINASQMLRGIQRRAHQDG
jgi:hypothetical protein